MSTMRDNSKSALVRDYVNTRIVMLNSKDSVLDGAKRMSEENISSVALTDEMNNVIGILTERDIVKAIASGIPADGITAGSLMSTPLLATRDDASIEEAVHLMAQKKVRHLLVEDHEGVIVGIITITDMVRYLRRRFIESSEPYMSELLELLY